MSALVLGLLVVPAHGANTDGSSLPTRSHLRVFEVDADAGEVLHVLEALRRRPGRDPFLCVGASRNFTRAGKRSRIVEYGCAHAARVYDVDPLDGTARVRASIPTIATLFRGKGRSGWVQDSQRTSRALVSVDWQTTGGVPIPWGWRVPLCFWPIVYPCVDPADPDLGGVGLEQPAFASGRLRFGGAIGTITLGQDSPASMAWAVP